MKNYLTLCMIALVGICTLEVICLEPRSLASPQEYFRQDSFDRENSERPSPQLVRQADAIAVGKVLSTQSYWNSDSSLIMTDYLVQISENLLGETPATMTLTAEGGTVSDLRLIVSHEIHLERDADYVFFLKNKDKRFSVLKGPLGAHKVDMKRQHDRHYIMELKSTITKIHQEKYHERR